MNMKQGRSRVKTGKGAVKPIAKEECLVWSGCVCLKEQWQLRLLYPEALNCRSQNSGGLLRRPPSLVFLAFSVT